MASSKKANYKGRSPNVIWYIESCGSKVDISSLISPNLAAGARLAAENQCQALDEKTARTYELRLIALENFAMANGDGAVLFGPDKRPFLAATIQTYMRKCFPVFLDLFFIGEGEPSDLGGGGQVVILLPEKNYTMPESVSLVHV